jgi:hypothetical protein
VADDHRSAVNDRRLLLESIAYGDSPTVTAEARLRAAEMLRQEGLDQSEPVVQLAAEVESLSDEELDAELAGVFAAIGGVEAVQRDVDALVESRAKELAKQWISESRAKAPAARQPPEPSETPAEESQEDDESDELELYPAPGPFDAEEAAEMRRRRRTEDAGLDPWQTL